MFCLIIPCNRRKIIFDEVGNQMEISSDDNRGIFTEFRGFITIKYDDERLNMVASMEKLVDNGAPPFDTQENTGRPDRTAIKFPQSATTDQSFNKDETGAELTYNDNWRKQHKKFEYGKFYSIAKFHALSCQRQNTVNELDEEAFSNSGVIVDYPVVNTDTDFPWNGVDSYGNDGFGAEWLNFTLHLPQYSTYFQDTGDPTSAAMSLNVSQNHDSTFYRDDNTQEIGAGLRNTRMFLRSDRHPTDFVEVPKNDIALILAFVTKGFSKLDIPDLEGNYKVSGKVGGVSAGANNTDPYFYKGFGTSDCIQYLRTLNII
jgi:hypothetical protein